MQIPGDAAPLILLRRDEGSKQPTDPLLLVLYITRPLDHARAKNMKRARETPVLAPLAEFLAVEGRGIVR